MILVTTNDDPATTSNAAVALVLKEYSQVFIGGEDAVRVNIIDALRKSPELNLFLVGHGSHQGYHDQSSALALTVNDISVLTRRRTLAYACHSSDAMGNSVAQEGGVWCGFAGAINCLHDEENVIQIFRDLTREIYLSFATVSDLSSGVLFIREIESIIEVAQNRLDEVPDAFMGAYKTLNDILERIRLHLAGHPGPLHTTRASQPPSRL